MENPQEDLIWPQMKQNLVPRGLCWWYVCYALIIKGKLHIRICGFGDGP